MSAPQLFDVNFTLHPRFVVDGGAQLEAVREQLARAGLTILSLVAEPSFGPTDDKACDFSHTARFELRPARGCPTFPLSSSAEGCPECDSEWAHGQDIVRAIGKHQGPAPLYVTEFIVTD
jgi:hypothetical protein